MHSKLLKIIERKKQDVSFQKKNISVEKIKKSAFKIRNKSKFKESILHPNRRIAMIAEIKLASPTIPILGKQSEIIERAIAYEKAGADGISFVTETNYFKGNVNFLVSLKKNIALPILQKDFIIDEYQIYEAKIIGTDALLLITRFLDKKQLKDFVTVTREIGMEPVVEIHNEEDLEKAVNSLTNIIAVNARDLGDFTIDVNNACDIIRKIPNKFIKLGFSGIHSSKEVKKYNDAGAKGVLVGTNLMRAGNIEKFIHTITNI